jgi:hypothetical protein
MACKPIEAAQTAADTCSAARRLESTRQQRRVMIFIHES